MMNKLPQAEWIPIEQLTPAEWNPRSIGDASFGNLCRSIRDDPTFLQVRPILATMNGTIWSGNMRFRAAVHLGWKTVPAILVPIPERLAKRRALQDNRHWAEWDEQMLAEIIYELHLDDDTSTLGFSEREVYELLGSVSDLGEERAPRTPPLRCPTCHQPIRDDEEDL